MGLKGQGALEGRAGREGRAGQDKQGQGRADAVSSGQMMLAYNTTSAQVPQRQEGAKAEDLVWTTLPHHECVF